MAKTKKNTELLLEPVKEEKMDLESIKQELKNYVSEEIQKGYFNEIEKVNRKLLHEKNKRIVFKNFAIFFLILLCGFLTYLLFTNGYFDQYINRSPKEEIKDNSSNIKKEDEVNKDSKDNQDDKKEPEEPVKETKPTLEDLKKEYSSLLDNYILNDKSNYISDYSKGNLSQELKKYFVLNTIDFATLIQEEDTNMLYEDTFALAYSKLFNDECMHGSFNYDGIKIKYMNSLKTYISDSLLTKGTSNIQREITNIEVKDDKVIIETIEGIVINNTLYDLKNKEEIGSLFNKSLSDYQDKIVKMKYTFQNNKLISLN